MGSTSSGIRENTLQVSSSFLNNKALECVPAEFAVSLPLNACKNRPLLGAGGWLVSFQAPIFLHDFILLYNNGLHHKTHTLNVDHNQVEWDYVLKDTCPDHFSSWAEGTMYAVEKVEDCKVVSPPGCPGQLASFSFCGTEISSNNGENAALLNCNFTE